MNLRTPLGRGRPGCRHCRAGRDDASKIGRKRLVRLPIEAVGERRLGARRRRLSWGPTSRRHCRGSRHRSGFRRARSRPRPNGRRLDPKTRATVIVNTVQIVIEIAVALQQAEAARIFIGEGGRDDPRRIVEGPPNSFACPIHMARPSESWTSGRQSIPVSFLVSENQYIVVNGARPNLATSARRTKPGRYP